MNRTVLSSFAILYLFSALFIAGFVFNLQLAKASIGTIYIRADGSIDPPTAPISSFDNVTYTLTGDITSDFDGVVIERDSITLDGAGHTLQGNGSGTGVDLSLRNNVTIENMQIREFYDGVILDDSSGDSISGNNITANNDDGIHVNGPSLVGTSNTINRDNITENDRFGIYLADCNSNNVSENSIIANHVNGVYLDYSDNNIFTENMIGNNGLSLWSSSGNVLRSNNITDNALALSINGIGYSDFVNDVDVSNTVNGKPIYYMVDEHDRSIPIDAGYVALVLCSSITVQNLNLTNNGQGILLVNTTDSTITQNNITNNDGDISLLSSCSNTISGNRITNSGYGIKLDSSKGNSIFGNIITTNVGPGVVLEASSNSNNVFGNNITNNVGGIYLEQCESNIISRNNITASKADGIYLWSCFNNIIFANEIANNDYGINIDYGLLDAASSSGNRFYHNNLVNNTNQVTSFYYSTSIWDDGYPSGGNYWSDYNGTDLKTGPYQNETGSDGIGDTPYIIDSSNQDNFPLMGMFSEFNVSPPNEKSENVTAISKSTVSSLSLSFWLSSPYDGLQPGQPFIRFFASGGNGTVGFCRLMIPRTVLNSSSYLVLVDSNPVNAIELPFSNNIYVYLYFTYTHAAHEVIVTTPEFASFLILPLFMIATLLTATICRRKHVAGMKR